MSRRPSSLNSNPIWELSLYLTILRDPEIIEIPLDFPFGWTREPLRYGGRTRKELPPAFPYGRRLSLTLTTLGYVNTGTVSGISFGASAVTVAFLSGSFLDRKLPI